MGYEYLSHLRSSSACRLTKGTSPEMYWMHT